MTVLSHDAVLLAEGALRELGAHAEEASHDHPEDGPGPAHSDGDRHPCDVAQADRGGQRSGEGLEVRDLAGLARLRVDPPHAVDGVTEGAKVYELEAQREEDRPEHQPSHNDG